ncbi:MAG: hypothetical protein QOC59_1554 [Microbacteriaceae bacterium]|nr:hypothetical protein [Microbacteriaceae bacterium]
MWMRVRPRALAVSVVLALGAVAFVAVPAHAGGYPSWSDVQKARRSTSAKATEVQHIKQLLKESQDKVARTEQVAEQRGTAYQVLRNQVDLASARLDTIKKEVAADRKRAVKATQRAGQLAATLTRTGGTDLQTTLLFDSGSGQDAATFLTKLGRLSKLTESNGAIAAAAKQAQNAAAATQSQMKSATDELVTLQAKAKQAYDAAVAANEAANAELQKEQAIQVTLQAQLQALESKSAQTLSRYRAGVAARLAAQTAGVAGSVGSSGWALPASGPVTDGFGYRPDQPAGANPFHRGTDIGAGCSAPIYAAHSGTVVYAGWYGTYGNFIEISHGGGVSTGYAHIRPGGTFVHVGQQVGGGQNIASVGTTGAATGCHLHFEVRLNEVAVNAVPYMSARGVSIG